MPRDAPQGAKREYEQSFPYTGEPVGRAAAAGREDAHAAVDAAWNAFAEWSNSAPAVRRAVLSKAVDLMMGRQQEIAGPAPVPDPTVCPRALERLERPRPRSPVRG